MEPKTQTDETGRDDRFTWKTGDLIVHRATTQGKPLDMPAMDRAQGKDAEAA